MPELNLDEAAEYIGIKRSLLERLIKNGHELERHKRGIRYVLNQSDIDEWKQRKAERIVTLEKADFVRAFRFALEVNYSGHTRADFGGARRRSTTQAVENWTQGALAEIAVEKFVQEKFGVRLELEFRVFQNQIVGQDIVAVVRDRVSNPPRKRVSVKSGKENGMFLIVPVPEVENTQRVSDYYVFARITYPDDFILRLLRDHEEMSSVRGRIPEFGSFQAEIVGYCPREELQRVEELMEVEIDKPRYIRATGHLRNSDNQWRDFVDSL